MQIYLAVTPGEYRDASKFGRAFAHVAYRIGPESRLLRQSVLLQSRGGLLSLSDRDAPPVSAPDALCAGVLRECGRRGYTGVLLDFEAEPAPDRAAFAALLARRLRESRRTLYMPQRCAVPGAVPLVCTAVSGGSLTQLLQESAQRAGSAARLGLDIQRLRMDFTLPARTGQGRPLSGEAFRALVEREAPAVFFSRELCARYFTYTREGQTHFVLFDDADTLRQKLRTGESMGFSAAFLMWPEIRDIAPQLGRL